MIRKIKSLKSLEKPLESNLRVSKRPVSTTKKVTTPIQKTTKAFWMPKNWELVWKGISEARKATMAPVDALGSDELVKDYD